MYGFYLYSDFNRLTIIKKFALTKYLMILKNQRSTLKYPWYMQYTRYISIN